MGFGTQELLILAGILLLLFGASRLPTLMRSLGRSVNEFKHGLKEEPEKQQQIKGVEDKGLEEKTEEEVPG